LLPMPLWRALSDNAWGLLLSVIRPSWRKDNGHGCLTIAPSHLLRPPLRGARPGKMDGNQLCSLVDCNSLRAVSMWDCTAACSCCSANLAARLRALSSFIFQVG